MVHFQISLMYIDLPCSDTHILIFVPTYINDAYYFRSLILIIYIQQYDLYYSAYTEPCLSFPCENDGTCVRFNNTHYACNCLTGFDPNTECGGCLKGFDPNTNCEGINPENSGCIWTLIFWRVYNNGPSEYKSPHTAWIIGQWRYVTHSKSYFTLNSAFKKSMPIIWRKKKNYIWKYFNCAFNWKHYTR